MQNQTLKTKFQEGYVKYIVIGILVIIAVTGLFTFLGNKKPQPSGYAGVTPEPTISIITTPTQSLSTSDNIEVLDKEINETEVDGLDKESVQIDQDIQGL